MSQTIMDSGPFVAWFSKGDSHHEWAAEIFNALPVGAFVCQDAPMDFADACVVRMADLNPSATVSTIDGHYRFFRKSSGETIGLLAPFAG